MNALYSSRSRSTTRRRLGGGAAVVAQNAQNLTPSVGLSSFDQRHTLNLFFILTSPVGETSSVLRSPCGQRRLLKDWRAMSGGCTAGSGNTR